MNRSCPQRFPSSCREAIRPACAASRVVAGCRPSSPSRSRSPSAERAVANVSESGDVSPPFAPARGGRSHRPAHLHRQHLGRRRRDRHGQRHRGRHPHRGADRAGNRRARHRLRQRHRRRQHREPHRRRGVQRARHRQLGHGRRHGLQWRTDRLRVGGGVRVQRHRQRRRLDRNAGDQRRLGHGARATRGRAGLPCARLRHARRQHHRRRCRSPTAERCHRTVSATSAPTAARPGS